MPVRGIRGATSVARNDPHVVIDATRELLEAIVSANALSTDDIASVIFTVTPDLTSEYPARAARTLGWTDVALLGAAEIDVAGGLPRCIRVLLHVNTTCAARDIKHIYLHDARRLRPDR
ncbi:MAG TPA: chorismate mutase [Gemmatimonadales bacterium]